MVRKLFRSLSSCYFFLFFTHPSCPDDTPADVQTSFEETPNPPPPPRVESRNATTPNSAGLEGPNHGILVQESGYDLEVSSSGTRLRPDASLSPEQIVFWAKAACIMCDFARIYQPSFDYLLIPATDEEIDEASLLTKVDDACREAMIRWGFALVKFCNLSIDIAAVATNLLDRYAIVEKSILDDRSHFQLCYMACIYIAAKVHGHGRTISSHQLAELSRGKFNPHQLEEVELKIGKALNWKFSPPTPYQFAEILFTMTMPPNESALMFEEIQEPLCEAIISCANIVVCSTVLLYRVAEATLLRVLPDRHEEMVRKWRHWLQLSLEEIHPKTAPQWKHIEVKPPEFHTVRPPEDASATM